MTVEERERTSPPHVVVVDHDEFGHRIESTLLNGSAASVDLQRLRAGRRTAAILDAVGPDVILLCLAPEGTEATFDLLRTLKERDRSRGAPVVVLAAPALEGEAARCYGLGANHFAVMPPERRELRTLLDTLFENLEELERIDRGPGEVAVRARAADPEVGTWVRGLLVAVTLLALALYAWTAGVFG